MKKLTAAVVGTGFIGPVHVEALRRAGIHVSGIVGSSSEKSRAAAHRLGLEARYDSLNDILADESVDAVHLATPNRFHFEQAAAVVRSGKHVLCEKPLAMNSGESKELVKLARASGVAAGVAYNIRFYPLCHEAAAQVRQGSLGEILHVTGSYVQDWLLRQSDFNWRVLAEDGGALRAIADIGTHWLDLVQFVTQERVVEVLAELQIVHSQRTRPGGGSETFSHAQGRAESGLTVPITTEDAGAVLLRFANGGRGSLWVSQATAGRKNCLRFEIAGSRQAMWWCSESPNNLTIGHRDRPNQMLVRDPALMSDWAAGISTYPGGHNEGFPDTFKQLFQSFYGHLSAEDRSLPAPFPTFEDGHQEILLCEAILKSHQEQRWVKVTED